MAKFKLHETFYAPSWVFPVILMAMKKSCCLVSWRKREKAKSVSLSFLGFLSVYATVIIEGLLNLYGKLIISDPVIDSLLNQKIPNKQHDFMEHDRLMVLPLGSPLGPVLANIFMCDFEEKWLTKCGNTNSLFIWFRYVDDTFTLFDSKYHAVNFLDYLNCRHARIKFTPEFEDNYPNSIFRRSYSA